MAALHDALKKLSPVDFVALPTDDAGLEMFVVEALKNAGLLVNSVPISPPTESLTLPANRSRSSTTSSVAYISSDFSDSDTLSFSGVSTPDTEALRKEWGRPLKLNPKEKPLGMSLYKLAGRDGKGSWFARRSVHEGLDFERWKKRLERKFLETVKVQGGGINGERRVEDKILNGVGRMEVYHLSAQFGGPTSPRDFITLLLTSDTALAEEYSGASQDGEIPKHFITVSMPCKHPDCPEREGFIRGQYQSVELIREIPLKTAKKSTPTSSLSASISQRDAKDEHGPDSTAIRTETDLSRGGSGKEGTTTLPAEASSEAGDDFGVGINETGANPVEWIMLTRSDPGGSVPRFMVERGTPGGIVADASKFLDSAYGEEMGTSDVDPAKPSGVEAAGDLHEDHSGRSVYDHETDGLLANPSSWDSSPMVPENKVYVHNNESSIYDIVSSVVGTVGATVAAHAPTVIINRFRGSWVSPADNGEIDVPAHRPSASSSDSASSVGSFASAREGNEETISVAPPSGDSNGPSSQAKSQQEKELQKLEDRKRKLDEKLAKAREKELAKKSEDSEKEAQAIAKAEERHQKEIARQEEKYRRELAKIETKREKERQKAEEKRRKALERDERARLSRELDECKAERDIMQKEMEILRGQVSQLQTENTALVARVGKLGTSGEATLKEWRAELGGQTGKMKPASVSSHSSGLGTASGKENLSPY